MTKDSTKPQQAGNQDTYAVLWNALGLSHQSQEAIETPQDPEGNINQDDLTTLSYEVLVRYHENDLKHDNPIAQNKRRHPRHPIGDRCQYRISGMPSYGQGLLNNISASGFAIGVYRKLTLGRTITMLIETGDSRQLPLIIHASVVREAGITDDGVYRYGCQIDRISNPNE